MNVMEFNAMEGLCLEALNYVSDNLPILMEMAALDNLEFTSNVFHSTEAPAKLEVNLFAKDRFADRVAMWGKVYDDGLGNPCIRLHVEGGEWGEDLISGLVGEFWHYVNFGNK